MKNFLTLALLSALVVGGLFAQTTQDPSVTAAKAKLEVVYDLGRVFGYIHTMDMEEKSLALSPSQIKILLEYADIIQNTQRIEPEQGESLLGAIEEKVLTAKQLMYIDELAIKLKSERTTTGGTGTGTTGGTSPIQTYLNGGPFNPMLDTSKTIGKDFQAAYKYLKSKK